MGKAFAKLLHSRRSTYPFRIVGIHTARHGTAYGSKGLSLAPDFGMPASSVERFLEGARPDVAIEITTLNPESGEPAIGHIKSAISRGIHVITANKGPIAHAYAELRELARRAQVEFRFESTVMDGAPVFNMVRHSLPGIHMARVHRLSEFHVQAGDRSHGARSDAGRRRQRGTGARGGGSRRQLRYRRLGFRRKKPPALANVFMDAQTNPALVEREGIRNFTTQQIVDLTRAGKTVVLMSRGERDGEKIKLTVRPEVAARH